MRQIPASTCPGVYDNSTDIMLRQTWMLAHICCEDNADMCGTAANLLAAVDLTCATLIPLPTGMLS